MSAVEAALRVLPGPKLVAVTGAGDVTGEIFPIRRPARAAHRHGARIVVDAAQPASSRRPFPATTRPG